MDIKSRIEETSNLIQEFEKQSADLQMKAFECRQEREALFAKFILEGKLLDGTEWEIILKADNNVWLRLSKDNAAKSIDTITDLINVDYHTWFELEPGVEFRFDDTEVSIHFSESKQVIRFVNNNGIIVNGTGISDRLAKLKRDVTALETVCHQFAAIF
jgi:hypothetical protein